MENHTRWWLYLASCFTEIRFQALGTQLQFPREKGVTESGRPELKIKN